MRKQERDSDQAPESPFLIQMKAEGQTSFLCGSITLSLIIQIYIHTSYPHLLKNRNKNLFTLLFQLPSSSPYTYSDERSRYNAKRWTYTPPRNPGPHRRKKSLSP